MKQCHKKKNSWETSSTNFNHFALQFFLKMHTNQNVGHLFYAFAYSKFNFNKLLHSWQSSVDSFGTIEATYSILFKRCERVQRPHVRRVKACRDWLENRRARHQINKPCQLAGCTSCKLAPLEPTFKWLPSEFWLPCHPWSDSSREKKITGGGGRATESFY